MGTESTTEAAPGPGQGGSLHATAARDQSLERLTTQEHDALIVGGGINGAISALALASHGLRVALIDSEDFGSGVSQESSNLIWGGFKYLQTYDVALVAGLCRSRNLLARAYASRIREVRFLAALGPTSPYSPAYAAMGAHAYWALGRFATDRPRFLSSDSVATAEPAIDSDDVQGAVEYSDYLLADNDARFVLQLLLDAVDHGAVAVSRVRLDSAERARRGWRASVTDRLTGSRHSLSASILVNAAGPRATDLARLAGTTLSQDLCYSKGAHIVVPQVTESGRVLAFFDDDQRLFYVIPMGHRSLIGTTDTRVEDAAVSITHDDRDFLLEQANARLRLPQTLRSDDVIAYRCGVRALVIDEGADTNRDWTELSRRHAVEADQQRGAISILGGKLSDCLNVGGEVVEAARQCGLEPVVPSRAWFGEPSEGVRARFHRDAARAGIDEPAATRLWRRHGRRALEVAEVVGESRELGAPLSDRVECSAAEVMVMARHEHILTMDDFLRRRTMLAMLETAETLRSDPGVERAESLLFRSAA
ncbi:MAG: FAD-dependent oxidoreductase [Acidimicrobiaceae bacterium]|nr:FAD-dependent oxidoreductase [Acidimicrobiaceae bacterium]MYE76251.1 FAD-dependent oxidoreductase [Acidimicrobiaceae bacterium]